MITTQEQEVLNKKQEEKKKQERTEFLDLVNDCLNNEKGKRLLEILNIKFNNQTDMNNSNINYFRDGKLYVISYLRNCINEIKRGK